MREFRAHILGDVLLVLAHAALVPWSAQQKENCHIEGPVENMPVREYLTHKETFLSWPSLALALAPASSVLVYPLG